MDDRLTQAMQQLLRYGAFAQLLTSLQSLTTVEAAAETLAQQWKFCANVGNWCFVLMVEREVLRVETIGGMSRVQRLVPTQLSAAELFHARLSICRRGPSAPADIIATPELSPTAEQLVFPVQVGGQALGTFFFESDIAAFDTLDRKFINLVASLFAARASDLLRQEAETARLRQQATVDGLTQIANRRQFDASLEIEWLQAVRDARPISIILVDIDFFKQYNDFYGHPHGDTCLREVARTLKSSLRPGELVARVGGEEFAILLPGIEPHTATIIAERARAAVAAAGIPHAASSVSPYLTASLGLSSQIPEPADSIESLYSQADVALYAAKRAGRNCVRVNTAR